MMENREADASDSRLEQAKEEQFERTGRGDEEDEEEQRKQKKKTPQGSTHEKRQGGAGGAIRREARPATRHPRSHF